MKSFAARSKVEKNSRSKPSYLLRKEKQLPKALFIMDLFDYFQNFHFPQKNENIYVCARLLFLKIWLTTFILDKQTNSVCLSTRISNTELWYSVFGFHPLS